MSLLSGIALFLAYAPWIRLYARPVAPLAAALFAGLWSSLFYANEAMPNMWVAYSGVAGVGLACLADRCPRPRLATAGVVAAFAVASLARPSDATWLALPLLGYGIVRRRPRLALATAGGLAIGWGQWTAEAVLRFGGPLARLHAAGAENATGLHFSLPDHLRALNGPLLCRFGVECGGFPPLQIAWFAAVPILALLGAWTARRRGALVAALACGLSLALAYIFTVGTPLRASCCRRTRCSRSRSARASSGCAGDAAPRCSPSSGCSATSSCRPDPSMSTAGKSTPHAPSPPRPPPGSTTSACALRVSCTATTPYRSPIWPGAPHTASSGTTAARCPYRPPSEPR